MTSVTDMCTCIHRILVFPLENETQLMRSHIVHESGGGRDL